MSQIWKSDSRSISTLLRPSTRKSFSWSRNFFKCNFRISEILLLLIIGKLFEFTEKTLILVTDGDRQVRRTVKTSEDTVAGGLNDARTRVPQLLHHFNAFLTNGENFGFADNAVVKLNALLEIQFHVNEHHIHCVPIDGLIEDVFKITAATIVEIVTLGAVVRVGKRVQITHANLNGHGELV